MKGILTSNQASDAALVGGKAASLAALAGAGFSPPPFFVVIPGADLEAGALEGRLAGLGPGPYAVRSSAIGEDGAGLSHAGQFLSELNVPASKVAAAIARVAKSGLSAGVENYRTLHGSEAAGREINVIVQQMIEPQAAGVAFSADPVSGRRDRMLISAVAGLADQLVSGEVDGEDWVLNDHDKAVRRPVGSASRLTDAQDVAALVRWAETHFGHPQDIEWAIDEAGLHILQSRPITTSLRPRPNVGGLPRVLDNSNIVESYPGLVSPLTYSFAVHVYARVYRAFVRLLGIREDDLRANAAVFDNMLGRVDGRVYYNLVNWYRALAMLPGFSLNRGYMETMMGVSQPLPPEIVNAIAPPAPTLWRKIRDGLRLSRAGLGLLVQAILLGRTRRRFMARLDRALGSNLDLNTAALDALAREYRTIEADLLDRWDAPLINDFLCMIGFGASRNLLIRWLGDDGVALHNQVMIGQGDIISAEPAQRIVEMAGMIRVAGLAERFAEEGTDVFAEVSGLSVAFDAYLDRFGDRCVQELKLESVPLSDNPAPLLAAILAQVRAPQRAEAQAKPIDWRATFPKRPVRRLLARGIVGWAKSRVRDRENLRFERTRIFGHARRVFLAMGRELNAYGLLDQPRDVFFLTVGEVLGAVEGSALTSDLAGLARMRRAEQDDASARPDPPERIILDGPAAEPASSVEPEPPDGAAGKGVGCSAGSVTAIARVITDPATQTLQPGEILVARHTDPGWIALFAAAGAIVVERGSLLSHSAIVARELGIPCVVGLKDATRWVQDGETISVDGATGEVVRQDAVNPAARENGGEAVEQDD